MHAQYLLSISTNSNPSVSRYKLKAARFVFRTCKLTNEALNVFFIARSREQRNERGQSGNWHHTADILTGDLHQLVSKS